MSGHKESSNETQPENHPLVKASMNALMTTVKRYLPEQGQEAIVQAHRLGAFAHRHQTRRSGEPYITHPLAVANILASMNLDSETLCAAILHDTIEDTDIERGDLVKAFGDSVADMVEGVTKLDKLDFRDRREAAAESLRKMMLAMSLDLRVIMIKLADRLHNMRTIDAMSRSSQRRIARETLDIYAPIAQRLGLNKFKNELQELGFRARYPDRHRIIKKNIEQRPLSRANDMDQVADMMKAALSKNGITHQIASRVKSPYSVYIKMRDDQKSFDEIMDVIGYRVVVPDVKDCYHALGVLHNLYKPVDGRFKDFIAIPKNNGYQSLHSVLFGPNNHAIELQIRTNEMDLIAERGIAAHWLYKQGEASKNAAQLRAQAWITELMESQKHTDSSLEFLENVRVDLFPNDVYLFTPDGEIMSLPKNATPLDFAYAIHTALGNQAVRARVNGRLASLKSILQSGETVEIITAKSAKPRPEYLDFVVTSRARTAIRHQLKKLRHEDAIELGHRMLDRALHVNETSLDRINNKQLRAYLKRNHFKRLEQLMEDIALGNRLPQRVALDLIHGDQTAHTEITTHTNVEEIIIDDSNHGMIQFARCCQPIPGDDIFGHLSTGKGIVVHRAQCNNVPELRKQTERTIPISWGFRVQGDYLASTLIRAENRSGALAQITAAIASVDGANIADVNHGHVDAYAAEIHISLEVRNTEHLNKILRKIRAKEVVFDAKRIPEVG